MLCTNQAPGIIQEGGISPLLGRFKGDCKGGAPARIQRSDSRGNRRNNGTDETCRLRQGEGCVVCSDANPPLAFSFYRQRLFLCCAKKKGLKYAFCVLRTQLLPRLRRGLCPPGIKSLPHPPDAVPPRLWRGLRPSGAKGCHPSGDETPRPSGAVPCAFGTDRASPLRGDKARAAFAA